MTSMPVNPPTTSIRNVEILYKKTIAVVKKENFSSKNLEINPCYASLK